MTLPSVLHFATPSVKRRIALEILTGKQRMAIAVTEPSTGSDVANLETTAVLSEDGQHFIVNGQKKWCTYGLSSEYFLAAVRTGGKGANGISVLLIERKHGGVTTRKMNMQGGWATQTAYVEFADARVPVSNLIGVLGQGFKVTMANFNIERLEMLAGAITSSRVAYESSLLYAHKRRTFGKLLIEHPVIRAKLANMARHIESTQAWLDAIIYQQSLFRSRETFNDRAAAPVALLKAHATMVMEVVAREASQIFGGLSYTRTGQGAVVERIYRDKNWYAIPGGAEDIMLGAVSLRGCLVKGN
jgi:alkylation response protein AidB-like acyl-CoA dehydrogenase